MVWLNLGREPLVTITTLSREQLNQRLFCSGYKRINHPTKELWGNDNLKLTIRKNLDGDGFFISVWEINENSFYRVFNDGKIELFFKSKNGNRYATLGGNPQMQIQKIHYM